MRANLRRFTAFTIAAGTVFLTACGKTEVNMNDFVDFDVEGYDTVGSVSAKLNYKALLKSVDGKINDDRISAARKILKNVKLTPEQIEKCRNGQTVEFEWDISDEDVEELASECRLVVTYSDVEYEVEDLQKLTVIIPARP